MKTVLTLSSKVKTMTETPSASVTVSARLLLTPVPATEPPTITGNSGNMHGAKTVSTPAAKDINKSVMGMDCYRLIIR